MVGGGAAGGDLAGEGCMTGPMEGFGGLLIIYGLGLLLVGVVSMPEYKRAKDAGYAPGFLAEWATAFIRLGCIFTPIGLLFLVLGSL